MVGGKQRLFYSSHYSAFCDSKCIVKFISSFVSKHTKHVYCDNYEIKASDLSVDKRWVLIGSCYAAIIIFGIKILGKKIFCT